MYKDYIPPPLGKRKIWYQLQINTADSVFLAMGRSLTQIGLYKAACLQMINDIDAVAVAKAALASAVANQKSGSKTGLILVRADVKLMKADPGYTPAGGEAIQVIDSHDSPDYPHYVPEIGGEAFPGYVRIIGLMNGLEALNIYRRVKGTAPWGTAIATVTHPKFDDHSLPVGVAAVYEYMIIGVMDDIEVTKESLVQPVNYGG
jgi:hypothetical protein